MEPPEIMRELFGLAPLPNMNPAEDFTFEITTTLAQRPFPKYRKIPQGLLPADEVNDFLAGLKGKSIRVSGQGHA